jgi:hypothetical protein
MLLGSRSIAEIVGDTGYDVLVPTSVLLFFFSVASADLLSNYGQRSIDQNSFTDFRVCVVPSCKLPVSAVC